MEAQTEKLPFLAVGLALLLHREKSWSVCVYLSPRRRTFLLMENQMSEQEGAEPQLAVIETQAPADEQISLIDAEFATYAARIAWIITRLTETKLRGVGIDKPATLKLLDQNEDNSALRDWMAANDVMTKAAFDKLLVRVSREKRVFDALGFVPSDELDFVRQYAEAQRITLTPRGTIHRARSVELGTGKGAVEPITAHNANTSRETQLVYDVANAEGDNLDSFARELRLISSKLNLGYRDNIIGDAIQTWQEETSRKTKVDALLSVQFAKGKATGPIGQDMWAAMERACFNVTATRAGFPTAVIQKFIWQVKRKARAKVVTNHLMPVLTGAQGKGKTEFVKAMTKPLRDLMREVDFGMLTDGKTTDIWSALILFIDEMGHFTKADVDKVKNVITTTELSIRAMRQNHSAVIRNAATLIGCSNKSLGQLIRDETGGRRFAELEWRNDPDWEASNALDWPLLWQSVDEDGPDPLIAAGMSDALREQQEANRNQHPVEVWAREYGQTLKQWTRASEIHIGYREWERDAFPRNDTSLTLFGRTLGNLIGTMPDFPLEKGQTSKGIVYRYSMKGQN